MRGVRIELYNGKTDSTYQRNPDWSAVSGEHVVMFLELCGGLEAAADKLYSLIVDFNKSILIGESGENK